MEERLTMEKIEIFLSCLKEKGFSQGSLDYYRRTLKQLYDYLPKEKWIDINIAMEWKKWMDAGEFSEATVDSKISIWNSLARFLGHNEWRIDEFHREEKERERPELTRAEYLRMLSAAKESGRRKAYFLIKAMGGSGIRVQELPQLTVEAVREGVVQLEYHNQHQKRILRILEPLRSELLAYAREEGIINGPIFTSSEGRPLCRASLYKQLNTVGREAQVDKEKVTPGCLQKMYENTRKELLTHIAELNDQSYQNILKEEQKMIEWEI